MAAVGEDSQGRCLEENGAVGGPGEADDSEVQVELPVDGNADDGDDGSGEHGGEGFAGGVEGAGVDGLRGPKGERDGEDGEVGGGGGGVGCVEGAAAEDEVDTWVGEGDHGGGAEEGEGYEARDGAVDGSGEASELVASEERGEEGHRGCSGGL